MSSLETLGSVSLRARDVFAVWLGVFLDFNEGYSSNSTDRTYKREGHVRGQEHSPTHLPGEYLSLVLY